jgi:hypothetical protein
LDVSSVGAAASAYRVSDAPYQTKSVMAGSMSLIYRHPENRANPTRKRNPWAPGSRQLTCVSKRRYAF